MRTNFSNSQSIHSASSDFDTTGGDTNEFSPLTVSPSYAAVPPLGETLLCLDLQLLINMRITGSTFEEEEGGVEELWRSLLNKIITEGSSSHIIHMFCLFTKLFEVSW
jgi:hypothetical protein